MEDSSGPSEDRLGFLLGNLALKRGLVTPQQLREALSAQSREAAAGHPARLLGDVLVARGAISKAQLQALLAEQGGRRPAAPPSPAPGRAGASLGKYLLTRQLGRGAMGVVYEAVDSELDRRVALKLLLAGSSADSGELSAEEERFVREAQVCATLKHPHIVGVYEAGLIDGKRFIAMELIEGRQMNDWRKTGSITVSRQVTLLRDAALAVGIAHSRGIIHRDLKPQNILVDGRNQPHVADFGLAKTIRHKMDDSLTIAGTVMGTPAYMSPEQAAGEKKIDRRTDVYALGVMLYEILTGRVPFRGDSPVEILMKKMREPVPPPSTLIRGGGLDSAIEAVCLKALARNPQDRYPTAQALADDLTRWLKGQEVKAAPPREEKKWTRRHLAYAGAAAGGLVLIVVVLILLLKRRPEYPLPIEWGRLGKSEQVLAGREDALRKARLDNDTDLERADRMLAAGRAAEAHDLYSLVLARDEGNARALDGVRRAQERMDERRKELEPRAGEGDPKAGDETREIARTLETPPPAPAPAPVPLPAPPSGGGPNALLFVAGDQGRTAGLTLLKSSDGPWEVIQRGDRAVIRPTPNPGGNKRLYFDVEDVWAKTAGVVEMEVLCIRESANAYLELQYDSMENEPNFGGSYKRAAASRPVTDALGTRFVFLLPDSRFENRQHTRADFRLGLRDCLVREVTVRHRPPSPDAAGPLRGVPVKAGELREGLTCEIYEGTSFNRRAASRVDRRINCDFSAGNGPEGLTVNYSIRWSGYFHARVSGRYLFQTRSDDGVRLKIDDVMLISDWTVHEVRTALAECTLEEGYHPVTLDYYQQEGGASINLVCFAPSGTRMAPLDPPPFSYSASEISRPPDRPGGAGFAVPIDRPALGGHRQGVVCVSFSPDGKWIASGDYSGAVLLWDAASGSVKAPHQRIAGVAFCITFSPDSRFLASGSGGSEKLRLWDAASGTPQWSVPGPEPIVFGVAFAPDGSLVATAGADGTVRLRETGTGAEKAALGGHSPSATCVAFSPDGKRLAAGSTGKPVVLWEVAGPRRLTALEGHQAGIKSVAFSPDGRSLASASDDGTVRLWDLDSGKTLHRLEGHRGTVNSVAFLPQGALLVSSGGDKTVRGWEASSGREVWKLEGFSWPIMSLCFSPDGRRLAGACQDWSVKLWEIPAAAPPPTRARNAPAVQVVVPARAAWTDTGIDVRAGDEIVFSATGSWSCDPGLPLVGPRGDPKAKFQDSKYPRPTNNAMALLGRVGPEGLPWVVGLDVLMPMPGTGRLYLGPNDWGYDNNRGEIQVAFVPPEQPAAPLTDAPAALWKLILPAGAD